MYRKAGEGADSGKLFELADRLARTVGTILEGAYFRPVQSAEVETIYAFAVGYVLVMSVVGTMLM